MNILLYHFGYRGDILVVGQNFTRELQSRFPEASIDLMVRPRMADFIEVISLLGLYNNILLGEKKDFKQLEGSYDKSYMIDERVYPEGHLRSVFTRAGFPYRQHQLGIVTLPEHDVIAATIVEGFRRPIIATQDDMARKWPQDKVKELLSRLSQLGTLVIVGPTQIFPQCGRSLSFLESAALLKQADLFVGIDSGIAHTAALVGTQTVLLPMAHPEMWISPTEYANPFIPEQSGKHISVYPLREDFCGHYLCLIHNNKGATVSPSPDPLRVKCVYQRRLGIFKGKSCFSKIPVETFFSTVKKVLKARNSQ